MLTAFIQLIVALGTFAPAPKPPAPKKLDRVQDPSAELQKELYKFDIEYRSGTEAQFAELERRAEKLANEFSQKNDQARIWYELAHVAGQSGIDKHAKRVKKYAAKCLAFSIDPLQRGRMWSLLASAVDLNGASFFKGRRDAAEILISGYIEMLVQELPERAPELPAVNVFDVD